MAGVNYQNPRCTRASLNARATANGLLPGQVYLMTDEERIAVALTTSTYQTYAKFSEAGGAASNKMLTTISKVSAGGTETITMYEVMSNTEVMVFVNGLRQQVTTDFTVSGVTVTIPGTFVNDLLEVSYYSATPPPAVLSPYSGAILDIDFASNAVYSTGAAASINSIAAFVSRTGGLTRDSTGLLLNDGLMVSTAAKDLIAGKTSGTVMMEIEGMPNVYGRRIFGYGYLLTEAEDNNRAAVAAYTNAPLYQSFKVIATSGVSANRHKIAEAWDTSLPTGSRSWAVITGSSIDTPDAVATNKGAGLFQRLGAGDDGGDPILDATLSPNPRLRRLTYWPNAVAKATLTNYSTQAYVP